MPVCPGCERTIAHDRLDSHLDMCPSICGGNADTMAHIEELDRRLSTVEQVVQFRLSQLDPDSKRSRSRASRSRTNSEGNNNS